MLITMMAKSVRFWRFKADSGDFLVKDLEASEGLISSSSSLLLVSEGLLLLTGLDFLVIDSEALVSSSSSSN